MFINKNQKVYIFFFCFFSLILSSFLGENSSGGSRLDNQITRQFIDNFLISFDNGIKYLISSGQVLSPVFFLLTAFLEKLIGISFLKYLYVLISSFIPIIFYISLKKKFRGSNKNLLFLISLIIFLSPYFRSSSSWLTTDNLATLFFILSISKFLSLERKKNYNNLFLCSFYLIIATYIRQYYAIFFPLYFVLIFNSLTKKEILFLLLILVIYFIPIFFYYYIFFSFNTEAQYIGFSSLISVNLFYTLIIFLSLYFFYLLPFYFFIRQNKLTSYFSILKKNFLFFIIISITFLIILYLNPIIPRQYGGGIFMKLSSILNNNFIIYFASYLGTLLLIINFNKINFSVYISLIIMFPFFNIYQKYYDPLLLIVILTLTKNNFFQKTLEQNKYNINIIFIYYFFYLVSANFYYNEIINI
jgi:hypothetical protein